MVVVGVVVVVVVVSVVVEFAAWEEMGEIEKKQKHKNVVMQEIEDVLIFCPDFP